MRENCHRLKIEILEEKIIALKIYLCQISFTRESTLVCIYLILIYALCKIPRSDLKIEKFQLVTAFSSGCDVFHQLLCIDFMETECNVLQHFMLPPFLLGLYGPNNNEPYIYCITPNPWIQCSQKVEAADTLSLRLSSLPFISSFAMKTSMRRVYREIVHVRGFGCQCSRSVTR